MSGYEVDRHKTEQKNIGYFQKANKDKPPPNPNNDFANATKNCANFANWYIACHEKGANKLENSAETL